MKNALKGIVLVALLYWIGGLAVAALLVQKSGVLKPSTPKVIQQLDANKGKQATNKSALVGQGQEMTRATGIAITEAQKAAAAGEIPTKELETARQVNDLAQNALDSAQGAPVNAKRVQELEAMVVGLNGGIKAATVAIAMATDKITSLSEEREKLKSSNATLTAKVETFAIERDAVASEYERLKFKAYILIGLVILALGFGLYTRIFTVGGLTQRIGGFVSDIKAKLPVDQVENVITTLDGRMDKWHQKKISAAATKVDNA